MSTFKIKKETKSSVATVEITDKSYNSKMECWGYPDRIIFEINTEMVQLSKRQVKKLYKFFMSLDK